MLPVLLESWNRVQARLRDRAGEAAHSEWLGRLQPISMERGTVYLEAETRFLADRVRALYRPLLQEVLSAEIGTQVLVELQTREAGRFDQLDVGPQRPVVDDSNRLAWLVLQNLRAGKGLPANLFLLHGESGVGKTFLLRWYREQVTPAPLWFDLPQLLKAFQRAHQEQRIAGLVDELTVPRVLVLDELHRSAGKPGLQQFLIRVLQRRETLAAATLLASRWHPHDVRELDPGLATRLVAGFVIRVDRPGLLGRLRYLRALEGSASRNGRAGVVEALARQCEGTYPELRTAWNRSRPGQPAPRHLDLIDPGRVFARTRDRVVERFAVATQDLLGKSQGRLVSRARKVLALLCLEQGLSGGEVGRFLGGRTRAAVSYMVRSLQTEMAKSVELRQTIEGLL
jgi:chromosomal replication initiator protein